jgi:hypothetical protein
MDRRDSSNVDVFIPNKASAFMDVAKLVKLLQ